jgi:hypothetical protein
MTTLAYSSEPNWPGDTELGFGATTNNDGTGWRGPNTIYSII